MSPTVLPSQAQKRAQTETQHLAISPTEAEEFKLDNSLSLLLDSPNRLEEPLTKIDQLRPALSALSNDASILNEVVTERASIADRISSKVRLLDLEQNRLKDCIDRVQALMELRDAFRNLLVAIEHADWEAATRHFQCARAVRPEVLNSQFAQAVVVESLVFVFLSNLSQLLILRFVFLF